MPGPMKGRSRGPGNNPKLPRRDVSEATPVTQVTPGVGMSLGLLISGLGALLVLRATDVIQFEGVNTPLWVLGSLGSVLLLAGGYVGLYGIRNYLHPHLAAQPPDPRSLQLGGWLLAVSFTTWFSLTAIWIAFGPGRRRFGGGITGTETEGRIAFGIAAIVFGVVALLIWVKGLQHIRTELKRRRSGRP